MTTVRISRLPELTAGRITDDDFLIINDGNLTTNKVSFREFMYGVQLNITTLPGDITVTGDVVFEGAVTGDFYNKEQVYNKIEMNAIITELNDYDSAQDLRINDLELLTGAAGSPYLPEFTKGIISDQATIFQALGELENAVDANNTILVYQNARIEANAYLIGVNIETIKANTDEINSLKSRVTALERKFFRTGTTEVNTTNILQAMGLVLAMNDTQATSQGVEVGEMYAKGTSWDSVKLSVRVA